MLDERLLETFMTVVETGSFRKTGELLHLSASGVAKHIDFLEQMVQSPLFERSGSGAVVTAAGLSLYEDLPRISQELKAAVERAKNRAPIREKPIVRLGVNLFSSYREACRVLRAVQGLTDRFTIQYSFTTSDRMMQCLDQDYEYLLCYRYVQDLPGLRFLRLSEKYPCLYGPADKMKSGSFSRGQFPAKMSVVMTLKEGRCPALDRGVMKMQKKNPLVAWERPLPAVSLEAINSAARTGTTLLLPDLGPDLHPGLVRVEMRDLPRIPYGLLSSDRDSAVKTVFREAVLAGINQDMDQPEEAPEESEPEESL